ncbi:class I SAM-dependent methyltransferase [Arenicella xantha]|uniref:Putative methyltransferase n=1 Tax=Arenicella xantha TaxID=644221 RepID=A0A395JK85_9GAMM|nr:class I SAM-dependent methyltransferase [Arenicella xantha]RBP51142.1 putative methyltransferase [Arenicella xantha]
MKKLLITLLAVSSILSGQLVNAMDEELSAKLSTAMLGDHRSDKNKERNTYRHPIETLDFFGMNADMTVLEIAPGGGWYTEILAPALRDTGTYIAGSYDVTVEGQPKYRYRQHQALLEQIIKQPDLYGQVKVATYSPPQSRTLWQADSVDMVLTFRSSHGWVREGLIDDVYADFYKVVKPGGILGVVQHRAPEGGDAVEWAKQGYVPESRIIQAAEKAGFVLDGKSEINANAKDLKDNNEGVWRLPPTLSLGDQDRETYLAIGESDRMTLRFKKPKN